MSDATLRYVGIDAVRPDVAAKLDGSFRFSNDLADASAALHGATVRSPHPHARIIGIDAATAMAIPGVYAVLLAADVPGTPRIGHIVHDQPVFAADVVRYVGEPVAFVVAETQELAWAAADAVVVEWAPLPVLDDAERALDDDAPRLHPDGNLFRRLHLRRGTPPDPDASRPEDRVRVEGVWETGRQDQAFLAPESALARPDADGGVTLHLATQDLHADRDQIAAALALPLDHVRLVNEGVGGAFGGREDITLQVHLCLAALHTGRSVAATYRRGESFLAHPKRHPARLHVAVEAGRDGVLRSVQVRLRLDGGAYASTSGPVLSTACYFAAGPYRVPHVDVLGETVRTNNPVSGAMRGFGAVQACFGIESTMDLLAERLGLDPVELRRRNVLEPGDRFPTSGQLVGAEVHVRELLDRCAALPLPAVEHDAHDPFALPGGTGTTTDPEASAHHVRRGIGIALGVKNAMYGAGFAEWAEARVTVDAAGATVESAASECGQGVLGVLSRIAAEELDGMPVRVAPATSALGYAGSSSASRQTRMAGGAVQLAARAVAEELRHLASERWPDRPVGHGRRDLASLDLAALLGGSSIARTATYRPQATDHGDADGQGDVHVAWMFVAHRAVVDVDTELGLVKVVQVATAQDVGRAVQPREVRGQILGGISQGIGLALTEHLATNGSRPVNAGFTDYLLPTAPDAPEVLIDLVEHSVPGAPYGLNGAGEPPSLSSTAAVAAAIRAATGRRIGRVPVRPGDIVALSSAT